MAAMYHGKVRLLTEAKQTQNCHSTSCDIWMWHKISGVFTAGKSRDPKRFGAIEGGKFQTGSVSPSTATAAAQRNAERLELMYGRNGKMMKN